MTIDQTIETPEESTALRDFRPGAFALRDTWFALAHTARIGRRPLRRLVHGEPVWFWRDDARRLHATEDSPDEIDRGRRRASEFTGGTGVYPLVERYGMAWVWYGNPEAASPDLLPNAPHIPLEGMPRRMQGNVVFDCSNELVVENLLDLTHADYLHSSLTGDPLGENDQIRFESTSETVLMVRTAENRPIPKLQRPLVRGAEVQNVRLHVFVHVRSGLSLLHGDFDPGMSIRMLHPNNPELPNRSRTLVSFNPQHMPKLAQQMFGLSAHMVGRQDNWAMRPQNPAYMRPGVQKDMSSRFDRAALRYRKVYQDLVERQQRGDFSYLSDGDPARDISDDLELDARERLAAS